MGGNCIFAFSCYLSAARCPTLDLNVRELRAWSIPARAARGKKVDPTGETSSPLADVLAAMQRIEYEAQNVVAEARAEAEELQNRAQREADERRKSAQVADSSESQARIESLLGQARADTERMQREETSNMESRKKKLTMVQTTLVEEVVKGLLPESDSVS